MNDNVIEFKKRSVIQLDPWATKEEIMIALEEFLSEEDFIDFLKAIIIPDHYAECISEIQCFVDSYYGAK